MPDSLHSPDRPGAADESTDERLETVAALLEDEHARAILRHVSAESLSASELIDRCGASKATTYRRLDRLREAGLVESHKAIDLDGHHHEEYVATLARVTVSLDDGSFDLSLDRKPDRPENRVGATDPG